MDTSLSTIERRTWRGAVLIFFFLIFLVWFTAPLRETPTLVNQLVNIKGALVLSLFGGARPEPLDPTGFPPEYRARLDTYLARRASFRSRLPEPVPNTAAHEAWSRRVSVEQGIVALIDAPGIGAQAAMFASETVTERPWDSPGAGPLAEAKSAETYVDSSSSSPLKPYVWLFLMHRYKAALSLLRAEQAGEQEIGSATMGYARARALAAGTPDPLIGLVATDLDVVASVYPLIRTSSR